MATPLLDRRKSRSSAELPPTPKRLLDDPSLRKRVRDALQWFESDTALDYRQLFAEGTLSANVPQRLKPHLQVLAEAGIVRAPTGRDNNWVAQYLVTSLSGMYYLTDLPRLVHRDEVFSPFIETRFLTDLMLVRPGDTVLDLGTGGGVLLLEAARRNATGLGIDISSRAVDFARINAALNEITEVSFEKGDMFDLSCVPDNFNADIILCNPPFEPVPVSADSQPFFAPLHSDGGDLGIMALTQLESALRLLPKYPKVMQVVLFSLGEEDDPKSRLCVNNSFIQPLARGTNSLVEIKHLLPPVSLSDYLSLRFSEGASLKGKTWYERMRGAGWSHVHLLLANFFPNQDGGHKTHRSISYRDRPRDDECFVLPLASPNRSSLEKSGGGESGLSDYYLGSLIRAREEVIAGEVIDLQLHDKRVLRFLSQVLRDDALLGGHTPVMLADIRADNTDNHVGAVLVNGTVEFDRPTQPALYRRCKRIFGDKIAVVVCDINKQGPASPAMADRGLPISWFVEAGDTSSVIRLAFGVPPSVVQRFVLFTSTDSLPGPGRQRFFVNLLSELAGIADMSRWRDAFVTYSVAHPLKARLGSLDGPARQLVEAIANSDPTARERAERLQSTVEMVYGYAELTHLLHYACVEGEGGALTVLREDGEPRFGEAGTLDLGDLLTTVSEEKAIGRNVTDGIVFKKQIPPLFLRPFVKTTNGQPVRLKRVVYQEMLFEAFQNATTHGVKDGAARKTMLDVELVEHDHQLLLSLTNAIVRPDSVEKDLAMSLSRAPRAGTWCPWVSKAPTGLAFVSNALERTGAGALKFKITNRQGEKWFSLGLQLRGLSTRAD